MEQTTRHSMMEGLRVKLGGVESQYALELEKVLARKQNRKDVQNFLKEF